MTNTRNFEDLPVDAGLQIRSSVLWFRQETKTFGFSSSSDRSLEITKNETAILELLSVGTTKREIFCNVGVSHSELLAFFARLEDWSMDSLECYSADETTALRNHARTIELIRMRDISLAMTAVTGQNSNFHERELDDAQKQFDDVETTISHAFREPHPALSARSYGEAFCDWLIATNKLHINCRVLEVGCGLGLFARAILDRVKDRHPDIYRSLNYTLFDLSPELQSFQMLNCAPHSNVAKFISGNIETYDFSKDTYDLVISNEVIADLDIAVVNLNKGRPNQFETEADQLVQEYRLDCVPIQLGENQVAIINFGAIKMIEKISRCLERSAHIVITEYRSDALSPKIVKFENHHEFTIHFGHLMQVAKRLGLGTQRYSMGEIFKFDPECETITMESLRTLREKLVPGCGLQTLPMLAYTSENLREVLGESFDKIGNMKFLPLDHPNSFSPFRFDLLELTRDKI